MGLAMRFNWDYWTIDSQPTDFISELTARLAAETPGQAPTQASKKAARLARLRRMLRE